VNSNAFHADNSRNFKERVAMNDFIDGKFIATGIPESLLMKRPQKSLTSQSGT
jgi:hypothetical protein